MRRPLCRDRPKAGTLGRYSRVFSSPHIAPRPSPLRLGRSHAVQARYSIQECPGGMLNVLMHTARSTDALRQIHACEMTPAVTVAPSHSRTQRSFSPALVGISSEVAGGSSRRTSNRPVRWPIDAIRHRALLLSACKTRPATLQLSPGRNQQADRLLIGYPSILLRRLGHPTARVRRAWKRERRRSGRWKPSPAGS
jgi:hypothetical protein